MTTAARRVFSFSIEHYTPHGWEFLSGGHYVVAADLDEARFIAETRESWLCYPSVDPLQLRAVDFLPLWLVDSIPLSLIAGSDYLRQLNLEELKTTEGRFMAEISSVTDDAHGWNQLAEQLAERITAHVTAQVTIANAPYVVQLQAAMLEMRAACSGLEAAYLDLERAVNLQLAEAA